MNQDQLQIIYDMLEVATDGNWPAVRERLLGMGHTAETIVGATDALAEECKRLPQLEQSDF